jgi:hypothetical protein
MLRIRNNGNIQEIKIPSDKLEAMQRILAANVSHVVKEGVVKRLAGGLCSVCGGIPTQVVTYDVSDEKQGAMRTEKYCDTCVKTVYERERPGTLALTGIAAGATKSVVQLP